MKTIFKSSILTVTAILLTAVLSFNATPPDCPTPNDGAVVYFPNPENCSTYWECSNGNAVLHECPDGLWYCSELQVCSPFWDFFCNFSHCGGGTGGGGDTGGGGTGGTGGGLDTRYNRIDFDCTVKGNGKIKLVGGSILEVDGFLSFSGGASCSAHGNETCTPVECMQLWQWMFD